ncbi:hypothetical protein [Bosea minatitlanensis]|nr:hypothetical protein [Bosea minatitlanensis]
MHERFFDGPCPLRAMGFLETMALKRSRINIEVFGPPASSEPARNGGSRADEAVMILTRLLGRQIAREQFERKLALERRVQKKRPAGEDA